MLQMERIQILADYLSEHNYATVKQIAKDIFMSETTVRRDLKYLQSQNVVFRKYGGAMLVSHLHQTSPYDFRFHENSEQKKAIAQKAVKLISPGDTVFLDESSTTGFLADLLDANMNLTVITNSLRTVMILGQKNVRTYCTGGLYYPLSSSFFGRESENYFSKFNANIAFFSSTCISDSGIISDNNENNVNIKLSIIQNAAKTVFLCDHTKFGKTSMRTVCNISDVDYAVSDGQRQEYLKNLIPESCNTKII